ncbi:hypothetical protein OL548_06345 [Lysinibacillus sp. MHQ-1]|nr:hypothetical protein OL548_06345 [Lysinibacillus sp. MHQ-1]
MLLDCDEQLFMTYKQSNVEGAENLLATWLEAEVDLQEDPKILGTSLSPKLFFSKRRNGYEYCLFHST